MGFIRGFFPEPRMASKNWDSTSNFSFTQIDLAIQFQNTLTLSIVHNKVQNIEFSTTISGREK